MPKTLRESAPEGRKYIVMGRFVWGSGNTVGEALNRARREARASFGSRETKFIVYEVDADAYVTDYGSICWPEGKEGPRKVGEY